MIGIGHVAEHQLKALTSNPYWELVGASDLRPERRELLFPQIPFFESAKELLENVDADVVLVSTPNCTHFELGKIVLEAGKNLLLEKPCCETPEQLDELIHISKARGTLFNVALHASHARDLHWFIDNRDNLELGDITSFHCGFFDPYIINGLINPSAASLGGSWFDSGINALSVIGTLLPAPQLSLIEARITRVEIEGCSDIQATVELACTTASKHCLGVIETNWTLGINRKTTRLFFAHTNSEVLLDHSNELVQVFRGGHLVKSIDLKNGKPRLVNHYHGVFQEIFPESVVVKIQTSPVTIRHAISA